MSARNSLNNKAARRDARALRHGHREQIQEIHRVALVSAFLAGWLHEPKKRRV